MEKNALEIKSQNKTLGGLREEHRVHEEALAEARKEQAKARTNVTQKERRIKKAEKALDLKVWSIASTSCFLFIPVLDARRNPILSPQRLKWPILQESSAPHRRTASR
jgi:hypothetical protein